MGFKDWPALRELRPDFLNRVRTAFVFGKSGSEVLLITGGDDVYARGSNVNGCLGTENGIASSTPQKISNLCCQNVKSFACGGDASIGYFAVAFLHNGCVYKCGAGLCHETPTKIFQPVVFPSDIKVQLVTCGNKHCIALSDDGKVFTWGQNDCGQLGHSYNVTRYHNNRTGSSKGTNIPGKVEGILLNEYVVDISCGALCSVVIVDSGKVFTWGSNTSGQLGVQNIPSSTVPLEVIFPKNVEICKITCGPSHVLALCKSGELYGWGNNASSQLCLPNKTQVFVPERLATNLRFNDVSAFNYGEFSVAVSNNEEIYIWGQCSSGEVISTPMLSDCDSVHQAFAFFAKPCVMPYPLRSQLVANQKNSIIKSLKELFGNPENSDLTFVIDNKKIPVHRMILTMRSKYFKAMLERWTKKDQNVVKIEKKSYAVVEAYLNYIYTDMLDVDIELAAELLQLADEYGDENFKNLCERSIVRDLVPDKVAYLYFLTRKLGTCQYFNRFCSNFALNHAKEVINSPEFATWDLDTTKEFLIKYVEKKEN